MKELTQEQRQPQAPNAHKKKPTIRLTTRVTMFWAPQRTLLYRLLVLDEVKCKTLSQQSRSSSQKRLRLVSLIENAQRHYQGSLFPCFEYVPHIALTIVLIIKQSM